MFNPPNSHPNPSPYFDLLKKITQLVQENKVEEQILQVVQQAGFQSASGVALELGRLCGSV